MNNMSGNVSNPKDNNNINNNRQMGQNGQTANNTNNKPQYQTQGQ